jgi:hypothetical protein
VAQYGADLVLGEDGHFIVRIRRRIDDGRDVLSDHIPHHGVPQGAVQYPVNVADRARRQWTPTLAAGLLELSVKFDQMDRAQLLDSEAANMRHNMMADS